MNERRLRRLRRLSQVPRWTVLTTIQKQSVAEHSFHVAHIALWLIGQTTKNYDLYMLLHYAMIHDETEAITGDIPSPAAKRHVPGKSSVYEKKHGHGTTTAPEDIRKILKIADLLEALLFIAEEEHIGNKALMVAKHSIYQRLYAELDNFEIAGSQNELPALRRQLLIARFFKAYDPEIHPVDEYEDEV